MVTVTSINVTTLLSTPDKEEVKACWAPITSELIREMRAPVWVRVKKAIDCFWTCLNTCERKS